MKKKKRRTHYRVERKGIQYQLYLERCYIAKIEVVGDRKTTKSKPNLDYYDNK